MRLRREEGAAAVEFALLLPLLSLIILGIMAFGILFNSYLGITHAAREGVRWAALRAPVTQVEAKAKAAAPQIDWAKATIQVTGVPPGGGTDAEQGNPVTVRITYQLPEPVLILQQSMNGIAGIMGGGIVMPATISSEATQKAE